MMARETVRESLRPPAVKTLLPGDVGELRLGLGSMTDADEALAILRRSPGRSVWEPDGREFALVASWRNRDDISAVHRWSAVRYGSELLAGAAERCRAGGDELLLLMELDDLRSPRSYERAGFEAIQGVVTYELDSP